MGRARYAEGYIKLTDTNLWQAHWFVYVRDPETGVEKRRHKSKIVGSKAKMKKYQAEEELRKITHPLNASSGRVDETTLGGFMDKRWKPLHEGDWRVESTKPSNEQFLDIIRERFATTPLKDLDKVELQEWLNAIATKRSGSAVLHVRAFLKSICAEAVEQDYLAKDPALKLKVPKLRPGDKTVLTWEELWKLFAAMNERDRLILCLEITTGIRPSELFALRRRSWDGSSLTITETVYRGVLRSYGKTDGSMTTVSIAPSLAEQVTAWLAKQEKRQDAFIFPNAHGGFITKDNYMRLVFYPLRGLVDGKKLNFRVLRRTFSTLAQKHGTVKDVQRQMRHAKPDITAAVYMQAIPESVQQMTSTLYGMLTGCAKNVQ